MKNKEIEQTLKEIQEELMKKRVGPMIVISVIELNKIFQNDKN